MNEKEIIIESKMETKAYDIEKLKNCANCFHFKLFVGNDCVCTLKKEIIDPRMKCPEYKVNRDDH
jgi:hypothetical protein